MSRNSHPVYSTGSDRICADCFMPETDCICEKSDRRAAVKGTAEIRREIKGRRGKTVTTISGLALDDPSLTELASQLKRCCGTGGSIKNRIILIQGDRVEQVRSFLRDRGFQVRQTGG